MLPLCVHADQASAPQNHGRFFWGVLQVLLPQIFRRTLISSHLEMMSKRGAESRVMNEDSEPTPQEASSWRTPALDCDKDVKIGQIIGEGATCHVHRGSLAGAGTRGGPVAVKIFRSDPGSLCAFRREVDALERVGQHPNVVELVASSGRTAGCVGARSKSRPRIALALAQRGDLLEHVLECGGLSEKVARTLFRQLLEGLFACHAAGVAHRDLKLENLLLTADCNLQICDFGFSARFMRQDDDENENIRVPMRAVAGSEGYMAPEVADEAKDGYTESCDIWSAGVCLFIMLAGFPPYARPNSAKDYWFRHLSRGTYEHFWTAHQRHCDISETARQTIQSMLALDPSKRATIRDLLDRDPWLAGPVLSAKELVSAIEAGPPDQHGR